ncbi:MAG: hypothetical protein KF732_01380 [Flavobacteriales bacterium]|nr:hypothetical protein [Flavobacteriales bacterium]HRN40976.1 hypothetical protein [Vicingus sp.]HRP60550.1 hypothetical protein [Vicingus sp.]
MELRKKNIKELEKKTQIQILNDQEIKQVIGGTDTSTVSQSSEDTTPDMLNGLGRMKTADVTLER